MKVRARSVVTRALIAQAGATIIVAAAMGLYGAVASYSALLGGAIYAVANAYAGWRIFSPRSNASAQAELSNIYRAEFGKLVVVGALCAATFASIQAINIVAFVIGCAGAIVAGAIGASTTQYDGVPSRPTRKI